MGDVARTCARLAFERGLAGARAALSVIRGVLMGVGDGRLDVRALFAAGVASAPVAVAIVDRERHVLASSARWRSAFATAEQVAGAASFVDGSPSWDAALDDALDGVPVEGEEVASVGPQGQRISVRLAMQPWHDADGKVQGALVFAEDTTARRRAEDRLGESEARYAALFEASPIATAIARAADGAIVAVNRAFLDLVGRTREEILGHTGEELGFAEPETRARIGALYEAQGYVRDFEWVWSTPGGRQRMLALDLAPVTLAGEEHVFVSLVDVTARRAAELAERSLERSARATLRHFEELLRDTGPAGEARVKQAVDDLARDLDRARGGDPECARGGASDVLVLEPFPSHAKGTVRELSRVRRVRVVETLEDAVRAAALSTPDVLVVSGRHAIATADALERALAERGIGRPIPLMVLVDAADAARGAEWARLGARDFTTKPLAPGELASRIRALLDARAAHGAHARLASLLELTPDGVVLTDERGFCIEINDAACRLFGTERSSILGTPIEAAFERAPGTVSVAGRRSEWQLRRRDGTFIPVELTSTILPDGSSQAFLRDIRDRQRAERELRILAEAGEVSVVAGHDETALVTGIVDVLLRELADVCTLDLVEDGSARRVAVRHRDPAMAARCEALGAIPDDPAPARLLAHLATTRRPVLVRHLDEGGAGIPAPLEQHVQRLRDLGATSMIAAPVTARGELVGALCIATTGERVLDQRDADDLERVVTRLALALENARLLRATRGAVAAREEVLGMVAHDLRTPLNTIALQAQSMRRRGGHPDRRNPGPSESIYRAALQMNRLVQDLLDVTRLEAGERLALDLAYVDPAELVLSAVAVHENTGNGARIRADVRGPLPPILVDRERMLQVFDNLLVNACKFSPRHTPVTLSVDVDGRGVVFSVRDEGPGIEEGTLPHLFQRFWQAQPGARRGAGLGLSIVKHLVEAHGGEVSVESAPGLGTTFRLRLASAPLTSEPSEA
jgi:PAS domain S-box-containing protein